MVLRVLLKGRPRAALGKVKRRLLRHSAQPASPAAPPAKNRPGARRTKYPALPGDRLLTKPVFVLSSVRSGSTLLRMMLNSHSAIHAPHELHLGSLQVTLRNRWVTSAMNELMLDAPQLEHLLWDRLLHREMTRHGKTVLVNKTPSDTFRWRRILECWPDASFIFLLRHPAATADSWSRAHPEWPADQVVNDVLRYMVAVEAVRTEHGGLTVRYEDITRDPEREMRRICEFIGIDYEQAMVDYGSGEHGSFKRGLGDWSERIQSGKVQPVEQLPAPEDIPPSLLDISAKWGYLAPNGEA